MADFVVLIGRSSAGGSCEISVRDLFCFLSVFCDPGPSCLSVSPMYTFSHWLHGILYTTPAFFAYQLCPSGELKPV